MEDIVFGKDKLFVEMAQKLGYDKLIVVDQDISGSKEVQVVLGSSKPGSNGYRVVKGSDSIRQVIERGHATVVYDVEGSSRKDFIHHRNSGLNQVLCKLMAAKNIAYGINFRRILKSKGQVRGVLIGRIMQNVRLCRKYKVKIKLCSFAQDPKEMRNPKDLQEFGKLLGISSS